MTHAILFATWTLASVMSGSALAISIRDRRADAGLWNAALFAASLVGAVLNLLAFAGIKA